MDNRHWRVDADTISITDDGQLVMSVTPEYGNRRQAETQQLNVVDERASWKNENRDGINKLMAVLNEWLSKHDLRKQVKEELQHYEEQLEEEVKQKVEEMRKELLQSAGLAPGDENE